MPKKKYKSKQKIKKFPVISLNPYLEKKRIWKEMNEAKKISREKTRAALADIGTRKAGGGIVDGVFRPL